MKNALKLMVLTGFFLAGCSKVADKKSGNLDSLRTAHQALYDQVMDIHDEVMPKMDDLYKTKKSLQDSISKTPKLSVEAKAGIENKIHLIDSASELMMVWMRQFNPSDSVPSPAYREYMEQELEKVKQVKALTLEALK